MQRVGFQLKVRQELIDEYRGAHEEVWPEMLEALRRHGWHNYSLFMLPDGTLFGYLETPSSFEDALAAIATEEVNNRWQSTMQHFFEGVAGHADETMVELVEVFHLA